MFCLSVNAYSMNGTSQRQIPVYKLKPLANQYPCLFVTCTVLVHCTQYYDLRPLYSAF